MHWNRLQYSHRTILHKGIFPVNVFHTPSPLPILDQSCFSDFSDTTVLDSLIRGGIRRLEGERRAENASCQVRKS